MNSQRSPPTYPQLLTFALFGKDVEYRAAIGNWILGTNLFNTNPILAVNNSFKIINTPHFFEEDSVHPDQDIIDLMARSYPGPNLFILAVDSENSQEENVVAQISKLQEIFGQQVTEHVFIILPDIESLQSLLHLKQIFNIHLAVANENLASECKTWCFGRHSFLYDYKNYSERVVRRRRTALMKITVNSLSDGPPLPHYERAGNGANEVTDTMINIILLGLTGTGKSASANTILTAGYPKIDPEQLFRSEASSMPITKQCEAKIIQKPFKRQVRLVDTPDFFNEEVKNCQAQVEACKRFCQQGPCVVLLVLQLGRITDSEKEIIQKLENKLGWRIRDSTTVLLTHGEDLKGSLEKYINACGALKNIVAMCNNRYHLFNNSSKDSKQVTELIKKIPNFKKKKKSLMSLVFDALQLED
ncbi:GTPase IMAP family member 8 isoform X2 [Larimichthys crocea]|uniref:GTPase IMAP family member 8 isoform X2 n=1 Tax=Larimichthys crocea TaxID=215358 RepID=UPI00054BF580|nr:GTPase IMAP family member 8 isoform X2 [Larimichthys crocea]